jgi:uncharacterized membrane protein YfcA
MLTPVQWLLGGLAALLIGFSKTGLPSAGILAVLLMALVFQGRVAVGTTVLLLIVADLFAVGWYRRYTRWDKLWQLMPWVVLGMLAGVITLLVVGEDTPGKDQLNAWIGGLVLAMLGIYLARLRSGAQVDTASLPGLIATGSAAGPIMSIYMTSLGLPKYELMGTTAWYFLLFNLTKLPLYLLVTALAPQRPLFTADGLLFDLIALPAVLAGVWLGRWALPRLPQRLFDALVLGLSAVAALVLILG